MNSILIKLMVMSFFGVSAPVHTNAVELSNKGTFTTEACERQRTTKPAVIVNDNNYNVLHVVNGVCINTVPEDQATHYLALSMQTIIEGYEVQISGEVSRLPMASEQAAREAQAMIESSLLQEWQKPYLVLHAEILERS